VTNSTASDASNTRELFEQFIREKQYISGVTPKTIRTIPFSIEARKILYRYLQSHKFDVVFPTQDGRQLRCDNLRADFVALLKRVGVQQTEGRFHAFRRFCARQYLSNGDSIRYVQLLLGHADITTTTKYLDNDLATLQRENHQRSPLESVRSRRRL